MFEKHLRHVPQAFQVAVNGDQKRYFHPAGRQPRSYTSSMDGLVPTLMVLTLRLLTMTGLLLVAACGPEAPPPRPAPHISPTILVQPGAAETDAEFAAIELPRRTEPLPEATEPADEEEDEAGLVASEIASSSLLAAALSRDEFDSRVLVEGLDVATDETREVSTDAKPTLPVTIPEPQEELPEFVIGQFLGEPFVRGTLSQRMWRAGTDFHGTEIPTPVLVATGVEDGPTLCLTAAIHGDELNGIKAVHRIMYDTDPAKLKGKIIGAPIVNLQGFQRQSRYLPDRRDLNRFFPGNQRGSAAARMAFSFFREVILHCDALVDLHTGSFHRTNLPQIRGNLKNEAVLKLTRGFGSIAVMHGTGARGTLRHAATSGGIPAVTLEAGEPLRVDDDAVEESVRAINSLMHALGMMRKRSRGGLPDPIYYTSTWLRADSGGILSSAVKLGRKVEVDELLGTVTDPITNKITEIRSTREGRILGMAVNQFVIPGFAVYHLGIPAPLEDLEMLTQTETAETDESGRSDSMTTPDEVQGAPMLPAPMPAEVEWDAEGREPVPTLEDRMDEMENNE